jgi:hypothetical protein
MDQQEALEQDTLVGAQRFLERPHPHRLIAGQARRAAGVGAERDLDVVLGDELVGVAVKAEGMIGERQGKNREGRISRRAGEEVRVGDRGERRGRDEQAHAIVDRGRVEQFGDFQPGLRTVGRPDALPLTAPDERRDQCEPGDDTSYHLLNLKPGR